MIVGTTENQVTADLDAWSQNWLVENRETTAKEPLDTRIFLVFKVTSDYKNSLLKLAKAFCLKVAEFCEQEPDAIENLLVYVI